MEYKRVVQTVVETPTCLAIANKLFSEEERADIVALVAADPQCGDLIRGTGGFRKVRVARKGMGKSGGARVVYIWRNERFPVFLIAVFPKNEKENLSMAERNALKKPVIQRILRHSTQTGKNGCNWLTIEETFYLCAAACTPRIAAPAKCPECIDFRTKPG